MNETCNIYGSLLFSPKRNHKEARGVSNSFYDFCRFLVATYDVSM